ncbi:MAG TPA: MASE3 domain-containing protein [Deltaproteobacteria bacterium]|nr:MASE3 domain-containing protein [Deltaproteobacteria bacterium]
MAVGAAVAVLLHLTTLYSYTLFHSLAEGFCIAISAGMFMFAWNSRRLMDNNFVLFLGIASLFIGFLDGLHALAYKGMGVFGGNDANLATELWILTRYIHAVSFVIAPVLLKRTFRPIYAFAAFAAVTVLSLMTIFYWDVFPDSYVEGSGLTAFKVGSEYVISLLFLVSLGAVAVLRRSFDPWILRLIVGSIALNVAAELSFTRYFSVYDFFNELGHLFKIAAYYLLYRAVIVTGLKKPYHLIFRTLQQSREELGTTNLELEQHVRKQNIEIARRREAEDALSRQSRWLQVTLNSIGDAVLSTDTKGRITFINPAAADLTGWQPEEALNRTIGEVFRIKNKEIHQPSEDIVEEVLQGKRISALANHTVLITRQGREIPIEDSAAPIVDSEGKVSGIVLVFHDVSIRKTAEREREAAVEFLRLANKARTSQDLLRMAVDFFQRQSGCRAVGIRLEENGDYPYQCTSGFPDEFVEIESRLCEQGDRGTVIREGSGRPALECLCGSVIRGSIDASMPFFTGRGSFWTNSTTELAAEAAAAGLNIRLRNLCNAYGYESVALIPLRTGEERLGLLQLNDPRKGLFSAGSIALWERLVEYLVAALTKSRAEESLMRSEEELRRHRDHLEELVRERTIELEERNRQLEEEISERIRAQEEKIRLEHQLIHTQKMDALGRFAGGIAHDLNNMLYPIILNLQMLAEEPSTDETRHRTLHLILGAAYRQRNLLRQILSFSRPDEQSLKPMGVSELVRETVAFIRSSLPSTIEIRLDIAAERDTIQGNATQIQQIVMNLCRNAADAIEPHTGVIEVGLANADLPRRLATPQMRAGEYVLLTVKDTGTGMTPEVMSHIFDPFFTTKEVGMGSGMGLSVVHGIIKGHGGAVTVESRPGQGSVFSVYLPVTAEKPERLRLKPFSTPREGEKRRVLLVDDEGIILSSVSKVLKIMGYEVTAAPNGPEALALFSERPDAFDLVITDHTMPLMTGVELAARIAGIRPGIPVILCTGFSEAVDRERLRKTGISELLAKPADMQELQDAIERVLDRREAEDSACGEIRASAASDGPER